MGGEMSAHRSSSRRCDGIDRHPDTEFLMFGDSALIEAQLAKYRP